MAGTHRRPSARLSAHEGWSPRRRGHFRGRISSEATDEVCPAALRRGARHLRPQRADDLLGVSPGPWAGYNRANRGRLIVQCYRLIDGTLKPNLCVFLTHLNWPVCRIQMCVERRGKCGHVNRVLTPRNAAWITPSVGQRQVPSLTEGARVSAEKGGPQISRGRGGKNRNPEGKCNFV